LWLQYSNLAARIAISNLHKQTDESFFSVMTNMRNYINPCVNHKQSRATARDRKQVRGDVYGPTEFLTAVRFTGRRTSPRL
jgi:hypothetical protein